jgi:type VI secretion system FHA domain protein
MRLTLRVTGGDAEKLGDADCKVFDACGGTIGRLPDNSWVLPDPYVSSRHALIRYENGTFYIEDTSTNGVFINSPDNRLLPGQSYALKSGDWIFVDPYEIRADIAPARNAGPPPLSHDPFAAGIDDAARAMPQRSTVAAPLYSGSIVPDADEVVDPLSLLGFDARAPRLSAAPSAADLARNSVLTEHYHAPAAVPERPASVPPPERGLIPDDWDPLGLDSHAPGGPRTSASRAAIAPDAPHIGPKPMAGPAPAPTPTSTPRLTPMPRPVPIAARAAADDNVLGAVLAGAGLNGAAATPELARSFGEIVRVVVAGVMEVLQARQQIKSEFRMNVTNFRPAANNPLKFSANVDDALHNLLVKRNPAYLGPVEAFEDAFADLRNHQVATLAGVRVAFEAMLAAFAPERLQEEFDEQVKTGSLVAMPARLRYWDLYRARYAALLKDTETSFRELFGDEFASAYESQLARLKSRGGAGQLEP